MKIIEIAQQILKAHLNLRLVVENVILGRGLRVICHPFDPFKSTDSDEINKHWLGTVNKACHQVSSKSCV